jgi:3-(3-hydroxy-phenyl)propionate hydroxylase
VRFIIEGAIGMGRVVCVQDPAAAAMRDQGMIAARTANSGATPLPGLPGFATGFLPANAPASSCRRQRNQSSAGKHGKLDGLSARLRAAHKTGSERTAANVKRSSSAAISPTKRGLDKWLDEAGRRRLIRPDRYVFGTGSANDLANALTAGLRA